MISLTCSICKRKFKITPARLITAKFCSRECHRLSRIGKPTWNKGKTGYTMPPCSDEKKKKISASHMGKKAPWARKNPQVFKKGMIPWNKGIPKTEEEKRQISEREKGKVISLETRKKISDKMKITHGNNWKGGVTPINHAIRGTLEYRLWREEVFKRDNYTCQKTGVRGGKLRAHHIQNFADYPELRFEINNGITLSERAHKDFHVIHGKDHNTKEQLLEFLKK